MKMKIKIDLQTMRESPRLKESAVTLITTSIRSIVMSFVKFVIQTKSYVVIVLGVLILMMQQVLLLMISRASFGLIIQPKYRA